jgi:SAM-dependent methyltransferase
MLDMGTGGGEALSGLPDRAPRTIATEAWPPNVPVAGRRLLPLGIPVIQDEAARGNIDQNGANEGGSLPFRDGSLDLICNRHESFLALEVSRVLAPGGTFVTQQVDYHDNDDLAQILASLTPGGRRGSVRCRRDVRRVRRTPLGDGPSRAYWLVLVAEDTRFELVMV